MPEVEMLVRLLVAVAGVVLFPGSASSKSPDGRFTVVYRAPEAGASHRLFLTKVSSGATSPIYAFDRHVSVLWAPDSRHFAVTDAAGSDDAFVVVVSVKAPTEHVVLDRARVQAAASVPLATDHHLYVEASRWLSRQELLLRVHGYGEAHPDGVELFFVFNLARQALNERSAGT